MPKPTLTTVASKQPRETAGSSAFRAFDYQVNVSMALVLDLFRQGKEFVALFDHHDDLVVFVGEGEDSELSFYQVKAHTTLLTFQRVPFDLESYRSTVLGRVVTMLEELDPDFVAVSSPFYTALLAAAGECTGNKTKSATVEELRRRVALDREAISRLIGRVQSRSKSLVEWWPAVNDELAASGMRALQIQRIKNRCMSYVNARRAGDRAASKLSTAIGDAIGKTAVGGMDGVLEAAVALKGHGLVEPASELYDLHSAMIVELMENMT